MTFTSLVRFLLAASLCFSCIDYTRAESVDITTFDRVALNADNNVNPWWTPMQHYRGKTFLVLPDVKLRPVVTEIDDRTGKITVAPIDNNPNYLAFAEGHQRFTLGIDPNGYLHVMGDMHGYNDTWTRYVERYDGQNILYWRSNKPLDVTGGFTFCGGEYSTSHPPGVEWGGDSRFFNDKNGVLYYGSRVRAFSGGTFPGSEPFIAYGIYRYDASTGVWTALGASPEKDGPGAKDYQTVLYWEPTLGFEAYHSEPRFDSHNRLHFSIISNPGPTLTYAVSDDQGKTWKKANGAVIPGLPLRCKEGDPDQADVVRRDPTMGNGGSEVFIDKNGKIAVATGSYWATWDGTKWTALPPNTGLGLLGPDGMINSDGGNGFERYPAIGEPGTHLDSPFFGTLFSPSELALQDTGEIFELAPPANNNFVSAKEVSMLKAVFGPTFLISTGGTATASSASDQAALAFDGKQDTKWSADAGGPAWLEYALPAKTKNAVCRYEITCADDSPQRDPDAWDFEASDDGSTWITLDSQKGQVFGGRNQTKIYPVNNSTAYPYYRLDIKSAHGGVGDSVQIGNLKLLSVDASVAPEAPRIFFAQNDNGKVWLSWTQPDHAATYTVKRAPALGGVPVVIAKNVTDPGDFCDTTALRGAVYNYTVSASNSVGESPDSAPVRIVSQLMPPKPPLIQTAVGRNERIVLNWLPLWGPATGYNVKRATKPGGPYTVIARNIPGLTYTDIKLTNDTPYYYVVSASNAISGESPNSREIEGTPFRWIRVLHYKSVDHDDTGTISASAENPPRETSINAFSGDINGKWLFFKPSAWLQYKFPDGTTPAITRYQIIACSSEPEWDPQDWEFQGSTDGTSWITLDSQKDQNFTEQRRIGPNRPRLGDVPNQATPPNTYAFENPNGYQYYRLNITRTHSGMGDLASLVLWQDDVVLKTPPPLTPFPSAVLLPPDNP
jgi:hypothetical protein